MKKIIETYIYDLTNESERIEFKNKYWTDYWTGIVFVWEDWKHYLPLSTDVIQPILTK